MSILPRLFLCGLLMLGVTACVKSSPAGVLRATSSTPARASAAASPSPKASPQGPASPQAPAATTAPSASPAAAAATVRLGGDVSVPVGIEGKTANVKNGRVVGSPVKVLDAVTGKLLKQGVTYYDGSFQIDVTAGDKPQPVLIAVELVDKDDSSKTFALELPMVLNKDVPVTENLRVTAGSTALVMLYRRWAEEEPQDNQPVAIGVASYIAGTSSDTTQSFGLLVAKDPAVPSAADVTSLQAALKDYVARTRGTKKT